MIHKQTTGITNSPLMKQSDESDWHLSPWWLSQLFLKWTLRKCGNLCKLTIFFLFKEESHEWSWWAWIQLPVSCYGHTNEIPFFFLNIIQKKFHTRHVPCVMHEPWQSLQFCINFNNLGLVLILYCKHMHLIIHFNKGATRLFLCTFFLSLLFNTLTDMHVAISNLDVCNST